MPWWIQQSTTIERGCLFDAAVSLMRLLRVLERRRAREGQGQCMPGIALPRSGTNRMEVMNDERVICNWSNSCPAVYLFLSDMTITDTMKQEMEQKQWKAILNEFVNDHSGKERHRPTEKSGKEMLWASNRQTE